MEYFAENYSNFSSFPFLQFPSLAVENTQFSLAFTHLPIWSIPRGHPSLWPLLLSTTQPFLSPGSWYPGDLCPAVPLPAVPAPGAPHLPTHHNPLCATWQPTVASTRQDWYPECITTVRISRGWTTQHRKMSKWRGYVLSEEKTWIPR